MFSTNLLNLIQDLFRYSLAIFGLYPQRDK
jgi:hypothetical protein